MSCLTPQLRSWKPDVLHVAVPGVMVFAVMLYAKLLSIPLVTSYHTHVPEYIKNYTWRVRGWTSASKRSRQALPLPFAARSLLRPLRSCDLPPPRLRRPCISHCLYWAPIYCGVEQHGQEGVTAEL